MVLDVQAAAEEQAKSRRGKELMPLNEPVEIPSQEEMVLDPRTQGVEPGRKSGKSLGLQL